MVKWLKFFSLFLFLFFPYTVIFAMNSTNYKIDADALSAGGSLGNSANFILGDTLGEFTAGESSSASYITKDGFWQMINSYLILTVDSNSKNLGSLLPGSPITGQTTVTVTTDAWNGYSLNVSENHPMQHTDTVTEIDDHNGSIATPLLWESPNHQGFGFTLIGGTNLDAKWGSAPNFKYAAFPAIATTAHAKTGFKSAADETIFGYKVDAPADQKSGAYSATITYTAVGSI